MTGRLHQQREQHLRFPFFTSRKKKRSDVVLVDVETDRITSRLHVIYVRELTYVWVHSVHVEDKIKRTRKVLSSGIDAYYYFCLSLFVFSKKTIDSISYHNFYTYVLYIPYNTYDNIDTDRQTDKDATSPFRRIRNSRNQSKVGKTIILSCAARWAVFAFRAYCSCNQPPLVNYVPVSITSPEFRIK